MTTLNYSPRYEQRAAGQVRAGSEGSSSACACGRRRNSDRQEADQQHDRPEQEPSYALAA